MMKTLIRDRKPFCKRIRAIRRMKDVSQRTVADALGIHRESVTEIEAGRRKMDVMELMAFCELMSVKPCHVLNPQMSVERTVNDGR